MFDSWKDIALVLAGLWLSLMSWIGVREVKRIDGKADRAELLQVLHRIDKRDEQYREDQKEAREGRRALHEKVESLRVEVARLNGK